MKKKSRERRENEPAKQVCYHCMKWKPIEEYGIQRNRTFLKKEQQLVIREFRRTTCDDCRNKRHKVYASRIRDYDSIKALKMINV
jgi:Zn finger protein HypA/HybF involved in hydrogenase expression